MVKRISAVAQVRRRTTRWTRGASGVLFNLFFAFHVVANRRARSTLTLDLTVDADADYLWIHEGQTAI